MPVRSGRRWGLILFVLLVDIGLAVAGGLMLNEGLSEAPARSPGSASTRAETPRPATAIAERAQVTATPIPAPPAPAPAPPAPAPASAAPPQADAASAVVTEPPRSEVAAALAPVITKPAAKPKKKPTKPARRAKSATANDVTPMDPYDDPLPAEQQ